MFEGFGHADSVTHLQKVQLVTRIGEIVRRCGLTQVEAAKLLGLSQFKLVAGRERRSAAPMVEGLFLDFERSDGFSLRGSDWSGRKGSNNGKSATINNDKERTLEH